MNETSQSQSMNIPRALQWGYILFGMGTGFLLSTVYIQLAYNADITHLIFLSTIVTCLGTILIARNRQLA